MEASRHVPAGRDPTSSASAATMELQNSAANAKLADLERVVRSTADVNAADAAGRTPIMLAIGGESWTDVDASDASFALEARLGILKMLLGHGDISLHSLNAPVNGVTPLGLAAWLDAPDIVRLLLEESHGMVSVDGSDLHGATPLMYAARDSRSHVVCILLAHGAKPDLTDMNHRSSLHFARDHPHILWLCERTVRFLRARETQSGNPKKLSVLPLSYLEEMLACTVLHDLPPFLTFSRGDLTHLTSALANAVKSADIQTLSGLIFSSMETHFKAETSTFCTPTVINLPDAAGWGAVHYCVAADSPSIEVLDLLYLGGADLSLYSGIGTGHGSPLHILAWKATASTDPAHAKLMQAFIQHLVCDLGAPLPAKDGSLDTCLHIAAEHGRSINVLMALLSCDKDGSARKLRNSRGLTALDVCRPEFRVAFGEYGELLRPASSASIRTIRPVTIASFETLTSAQDVLSAYSAPQANRATGTQPEGALAAQDDISQLPLRILGNLQTLSRDFQQDSTVGIDAISALLQETADCHDRLMASMHHRLEDVQADVKYIGRMHGQVQRVLTESAEALGKALGVSFAATMDPPRAHPTDSESTLCSRMATQGSVPMRKCVSMTNLRSNKTAPTSSPGKLSTKTSPDVSPSSTTSDSASRILRGRASWRVLPQWSRDGSSDRDKKEGGSKDDEEWSGRDQAVSGTARFKAWLLRKFGPRSPIAAEHSDSHEIVVTEPEDAFAEGNSYAHLSEEQNQVISTCRRVLQTARRDMARIQECMIAAERYSSLAEQALGQTERRLLRMIEKRRATLDAARLSQFGSTVPESPSVANLTPTSPSSFHLPVFDARLHPTLSPLSLSSNASSRSSMISFSSTLIEEEDDDIGSLRRLLTRKIEARLSGAIDEMDKAEVWLRIVREVVSRLKDTHLP
ncbi:hypothetical protein OBBRIDRAFT_578211 [Obba rivulosa]|uniref:Ankyrin n=1 Tax=Obba rivulosa TaxID=1052685 RepID=A0A8E2J646_9APHY|nr:hypothetical protein OBBRIDRAFT_578211 [Obba rivulosa]